MKKMSNTFFLLAVVFSHIMCAVVAYHYCDMQWGIQYAGYSAPVEVAFLQAIPYGIIIAICVVVAMVLKRKGK